MVSRSCCDDPKVGLSTIVDWPTVLLSLPPTLNAKISSRRSSSPAKLANVLYAFSGQYTSLIGQLKRLRERNSSERFIISYGRALRDILMRIEWVIEKQLEAFVDPS